MVCIADPSRGRRANSEMTRLVVAALVSVSFAAATASAQLIPTEKPVEIRGLELQNRLGEKLPLDIELQDASGRKVKLGDKLGKGRPVVITMIYLRCPLLCPQTQQKVIASFNQIPDFTIGHDYDVLFVSFDSRDTAADAARERDQAIIQYDRPTTEVVRQGFSYLVGSIENTQKLADSLGFAYRFLKESGEFSHGTAVYVVTPEGVVSQCFTKLEYDPKDLRLALVDASGGKIGTLLDLFTLWCYHPTDSGEYVIAPMNVMRIGSAISAVVVGSVVGVWAYRDSKRRRRLRENTPDAGIAPMNQQSHSSSALPSALGHSR